MQLSFLSIRARASSQQLAQAIWSDQVICLVYEQVKTKFWGDFYLITLKAPKAAKHAVFAKSSAYYFLTKNYS